MGGAFHKNMQLRLCVNPPPLLWFGVNEKKKTLTSYLIECVESDNEFIQIHEYIIQNSIPYPAITESFIYATQPLRGAIDIFNREGGGEGVILSGAQSKYSIVGGAYSLRGFKLLAREKR